MKESANQTKVTTGRRSFLGLAAAGAIVVPATLTGSPRAAHAAPTAEALVQRHFRDIQDHENEHVQFLVTALGTKHRPRPIFKGLKTQDLDTFLTMAQTFENVGVGAYLYATPNIASAEYVAAAGRIFAIEARHAGFLNTYLGDRITNNVYGGQRDFERGLSPAAVRSLAGPYVESLNGGPPLDYENGQDIEILNFALALEYLEQEFYNLNVPYFYGVDTQSQAKEEETN